MLGELMPGGLVLLVAVAAGLMGAMTSTGGGLILIPALTLCGVDIKRAIAVSALSMIVVSNTAASQYVRRHLPNLKLGAYLEAFAVTGSLVGAWMTVTVGRRLLFFLCGGILLLSGLMLWHRRKRPWQAVTSQDAASRWLGLAGSYYDTTERRTIAYRGRRAVLGGLLMFGAAAGVGSSAMTVLIHDAVIGLPHKVSVTTSNLIIGVMALAGVSVYLEAGLIDLRLAVPVILGALAGSRLGSQLLVDAPNRVARMVFLTALVALGIQLLIRGYLGAT